MPRIVFGLVLLGCLGASATAPGRASVDDVLATIAPSWIAPHVRFLADATLQGRDTASPGYQIAANYVAAQFETLGLTPAGDRGSYFQTVPIRESSTIPDSVSVEIDTPAGRHALQYDRDVLVHASGSEDAIDVSSAPLVFVGYGVSAPRGGYDDYAGVDVRGKIAVFLPGIPASLPRDVAAVETRLGRRVEVAREHGALALLEIAPQQPAAALREHAIRQVGGVMWRDGSGAAHSIHLGGGYALLTKEGVPALFEGQAHSPQDVIAALKRGPLSFPLAGTATIHARFAHRDTSTVNVAAIIRGRELPDEYVVYSAHLDHDGVSDFFPGDHVLHGALDNAGGIATILAAARAFAGAQPPRRSILFLAVTGEEKGLVGSDYFAHAPTVPLASIAADVNCDNFLWYGPLRDIAGIGLDYTTMGEEFAAAADRLHLATSPVPTAVPGVFTLSDHFSFLSAGVPAVSVMNGEQSGDGQRSGTDMWVNYMQHIHHTPQDSVEQNIDWDAAVTETRFVFLFGRLIADDVTRPKLKATAFFSHAR